MGTDRKKPGVAFWATVVVVVLLVAYPLSFGPACWIARRGGMKFKTAARIYKPVIQAAGLLPDSTKQLVDWYSGSAPMGYEGGMLEALDAELSYEDLSPESSP
jgi:hypothetical protein